MSRVREREGKGREEQLDQEARTATELILVEEQSGYDEKVDSVWAGCLNTGQGGQLVGSGQIRSVSVFLQRCRSIQVEAVCERKQSDWC